MIQVTINNITGSSPYNIYVCDSNQENCFWISIIDTLPYNFIIPPPYDIMNEFCIKVVDSNACNIIKCETIP
jgi:hypothetical protein